MHGDGREDKTKVVSNKTPASRNTGGVFFMPKFYFYNRV